MKTKGWVLHNCMHLAKIVLISKCCGKGVNRCIPLTHDSIVRGVCMCVHVCVHTAWLSECYVCTQCMALNQYFQVQYEHMQYMDRSSPPPPEKLVSHLTMMTLFYFQPTHTGHCGLSCTCLCASRACVPLSECLFFIHYFSPGSFKKGLTHQGQIYPALVNLMT